MSNFCADSGFLIALYDSTDSWHTKAVDLFRQSLDRPSNRLTLPWPIMYESLSTRLARNRQSVESLDRDLKRLETRRQIQYWDDKPFRDRALEDFLREAGRPAANYRALSLVDRILRLMLSDVNLKIDFFVTFNGGDFQDVCMRSRRQMIP